MKLLTVLAAFLLPAIAAAQTPPTIPSLNVTGNLTVGGTCTGCGSGGGGYTLPSATSSTLGGVTVSSGSAALGTIANQSAASVSITGGTVSGADASGANVTATGQSNASTLALRSSRELNVIDDFGAKCDGSTDDTVALQAALTYAVTGHPLFFPAGTCIHTGLVVDASAGTAGVLIHGAGAGVSVLKLSGVATGYGIEYKAGNGYEFNPTVFFRDITFNGNNFGTDLFYIHSGTTGYPQGPQLQNVGLINAGRDSLVINGANAGRLQNVQISYPNRNNILFVAGSDWRFQHLEVSGASQYGVVVEAVSSASGLVKITTLTPHGLSTGDVVDMVGLNSTAGSESYTAGQGEFTITVYDANHFSLNGSTYDSSYTTGGWVYPVMTVTGAADNGSGAIRLTLATNRLTTGQQVYVRDVGGVTNAWGLWTATVVDSSHIDLVNSQFGGTYTSGGTVRLSAANIWLQSTGANYFDDTTAWNGLIGFAVTCNSGDPFRVNGGEFNQNWFGGLVSQRYGVSPGDSIVNMAFSENSFIGSGLYSDIQLFSSGSVGMSGNQFYLTAGLLARWLVETQGAPSQQNWGQNFFNQSGSYQAYLSNPTNDTMGIPVNRYGATAGYNNNSGGGSSIVMGYNGQGNGQGSFVTGVQGGDRGKRGLFYGGTIFTNGGGHQASIQIMSQFGTTNTPVQLTTDRGAANSTNEFNIVRDNSTLTYSNCVAVAQQASSGNRAMWQLPPIVLKRDTGASSVALMTGTGVLTSGTQTVNAYSTGWGGLTLSVTADTTNGGLNVQGTGLASTNTHWTLQCDGREVD